jgi:hypothetical protein
MKFDLPLHDSEDKILFIRFSFTYLTYIRFVLHLYIDPNKLILKKQNEWVTNVKALFIFLNVFQCNI